MSDFSALRNSKGVGKQWKWTEMGWLPRQSLEGKVEEMTRFLNWGKMPITPYPDCCCQFTTQYLWPFTWHVILHSLIGDVLCSTQKPKSPDTSQEDSVVIKGCFLSQRRRHANWSYSHGNVFKGSISQLSNGIAHSGKVYCDIILKVLDLVWYHIFISLCSTQCQTQQVV